MEPAKLLSVEEAAMFLKISPQQVRTYCRSGAIPAQRVGSTWAIAKEGLPSFLERNPSDRKSLINRDDRPIALSFFSGAMGLDLGIQKAGFNVILTCEIEKSCRSTIVANHPEIGLIGDINDYSTEEILAYAGLSKGEEVDLIIGGPPCQAFSTAGKRNGLNDTRGNVFLTFIERALEIKPKFFVIENVRGLLSCPLKHVPHSERIEINDLETNDLKPGGALRCILEKIRCAGYGISFNLYNAANFGSPQIRERVVIVCSRDGKVMPFLPPTHAEGGKYGLKKWRTFREATIGLDEDNCHHLDFPETRLKYYRMLKPGQYWKHLPQELQKEALGNSYFSGGGKTGFLRRLSWEKPSPTLVTNPAMPATDLAHPEKDRPLTIEEYKRLQEFPDEYVIVGRLLDQYKQVGNAVPGSLGFAIGGFLLKALSGSVIPEIKGFEYSRYKYTSHLDWEKSLKNHVIKQSGTKQRHEEQKQYTFDF